MSCFSVNKWSYETTWWYGCRGGGYISLINMSVRQAWFSSTASFLPTYFCDTIQAQLETSSFCPTKILFILMKLHPCWLTCVYLHYKECGRPHCSLSSILVQGSQVKSHIVRWLVHLAPGRRLDYQFYALNIGKYQFIIFFFTNPMPNVWNLKKPAYLFSHGILSSFPL